MAFTPKLKNGKVLIRSGTGKVIGGSDIGSDCNCDPLECYDYIITATLDYNILQTDGCSFSGFNGKEMDLNLMGFSSFKSGRDLDWECRCACWPYYPVSDPDKCISNGEVGCLRWSGDKVYGDPGQFIVEGEFYKRQTIVGKFRLPKVPTGEETNEEHMRIHMFRFQPWSAAASGPYYLGSYGCSFPNSEDIGNEITLSEVTIKNVSDTPIYLNNANQSATELEIEIAPGETVDGSTVWGGNPFYNDFLNTQVEYPMDCEFGVYVDRCSVSSFAQDYNLNGVIDLSDINTHSVSGQLNNSRIYVLSRHRRPFDLQFPYP